MGIKYRDIIKKSCQEAIMRCLNHVVKYGFEDDEHLYIIFDTKAPGVLMSDSLLKKFPKEMIVILQHQFTNLVVNPSTFEVTLSFSGLPERIAVPFAAIQCFYDPSSDFNIEIHDDSILMLHRVLEAQNDDDIAANFGESSISIVRGAQGGDNMTTEYRIITDGIDEGDEYDLASLKLSDDESESFINDYESEAVDEKTKRAVKIFDIRDYMAKDKAEE